MKLASTVYVPAPYTGPLCVPHSFHGPWYKQVTYLAAKISLLIAANFSTCWKENWLCHMQTITGWELALGNCRMLKMCCSLLQQCCQSAVHKLSCHFYHPESILFTHSYHIIAHMRCKSHHLRIQHISTRCFRSSTICVIRLILDLAASLNNDGYWSTTHAALQAYFSLYAQRFLKYWGSPLTENTYTQKKREVVSVVSTPWHRGREDGEHKEEGEGKDVKSVIQMAAVVLNSYFLSSLL